MRPKPTAAARPTWLRSVRPRSSAATMATRYSHSIVFTNSPRHKAMPATIGG